MVKKNGFIPILEQLRSDARASIVAIARATKLSRSMVFRRMKVINKYHIKKYTTLVDFKKLDYKVRVVFFLNSKSKKLFNYLSKSCNVNAVLLVTGKHNLYVDTYFRNLSQFNDFDERIRILCKKKKEYFVINEMKTEEFINAKNSGNNSWH